MNRSTTSGGTPIARATGIRAVGGLRTLCRAGLVAAAAGSLLIGLGTTSAAARPHISCAERQQILPGTPCPRFPDPGHRHQRFGPHDRQGDPAAPTAPPARPGYDDIEPPQARSPVPTPPSDEFPTPGIAPALPPPTEASIPPPAPTAAPLPPEPPAVPQHGEPAVDFGRYAAPTLVLGLVVAAGYPALRRRRRTRLTTSTRARTAGDVPPSARAELREPVPSPVIERVAATDQLSRADETAVNPTGRPRAADPSTSTMVEVEKTPETGAQTSSDRAPSCATPGTCDAPRPAADAEPAMSGEPHPVPDAATTTGDEAAADLEPVATPDDRTQHTVVTRRPPDAPDTTCRLPDGTEIEHVTTYADGVVISTDTYRVPDIEPITVTTYTQTFPGPYLGEGTSYDATRDSDGNLLHVTVHGSATIREVWYEPGDGWYTICGTDGSITRRHRADPKHPAPVPDLKTA